MIDTSRKVAAHHVGSDEGGPLGKMAQCGVAMETGTQARRIWLNIEERMSS